MLENGYPRKYINKLIFNTNNNLSNNLPITENNPVETNLQTSQSLVNSDNTQNVINNIIQFKFTTFPYIENLTHKIIKIFKENNIKFALYNYLTNNTIFNKNKDKIQLLDRSNLVYKINCLNCNLSYIGHTSQLLKQRVSLHKSDSRLRPNRCTLANHVHGTDCEMDYENIKILETETNLFKRQFLEMCHINENIENCINSKSDIQNLNRIYSYILDIEKQKFLNNVDT